MRWRRNIADRASQFAAVILRPSSHTSSNPFSPHAPDVSIAIGTKSIPAGNGRRRWCDSILEDFECRKQDEHHIESHVQGELVPALACSFSKAHPDHLAVADEDGGLLILNTLKTSIHSLKQDWLAHTNAIFDIDWMPGEAQLLTASGDQTIALWDVENETKTCTFGGHKSSVKSVRFQDDSKDIFVSGSRDGHVMIWDCRVNKQSDSSLRPVIDVQNAHMCTPSNNSKKTKEKQTTQHTVTAVVFQDDQTVISAGSVDGSIKVWDLRRMSSAKSFPMPKNTFSCGTDVSRTYGICNLILDSTRTRLFASCLDNTIYQYDCVNFNPRPVATFKGHVNKTFYVKTAISPGDDYLLSGSSDHNAYIWPIDDPLKGPLILAGHNAEVTAVAWCPNDLMRLVTLSDDDTMWIWRGNRFLAPCQDGNIPDTIVGRTEKPPIRIGMHCGPHTPRKSGLMLQSPNKLSTAVQKSLRCLPSNVKSSPSILKYFGKKVSRSVPVNSPRKLIISPSKTKHSDIERNRAESVKRKLCDDSLEFRSNRSPIGPKPVKTLKLDIENVACSSLVRDSSEDLDSTIGSRILTTIQINECKQSTDSPCCSLSENIRKEDNNIAVDGTPIKDSRFCYSSQFSSPTANLPNYVFDPQPRTPVAKCDVQLKTRTPDWLTQMRLSKEQKVGLLKEQAANPSPSGVTKSPNVRKNSGKSTTTQKSKQRK